MSLENDTAAEVFDPSNPLESTAANKEDRGDVVEPQLNPAALAAVVAEGVKEPQAADGERADPLDAGEPVEAAVRIPKARFDQVNEGRKAALARAEAAEAALAALRGEAEPTFSTPQFDIDAAEEAYGAALIDGDTRGAAALRRQINDHIQQAAVQQYAALNAQREVAVAVDDVVAQTLDAFPYLDTPDGQQALQIIIDTADAAMARGVAQHVAIANAVNAIAPRFAPAGGRALPDVAASEDTRGVKSLRRNAADSMQQPAAIQAGIGNRAQAARVDVSRMSDREFEALPEAEKSRLRRD